MLGTTDGFFLAGLVKHFFSCFNLLHFWVVGGEERTCTKYG